MNIQYKALYRRPSFYISTAVIVIAIIGAAMALFMFKQPFASAYSGAGTAANPYLLTNCTDLQELTNETTTYNRYYALQGDIDCTATTGWNGGDGFAPIQGFRGVLDGKNYNIDGLYISRSGDGEVGLFSTIESGMILNLSLSNASVSGDSSVGAIAGSSGATIHNIRVGNSNITGQTGNVGGIIGSATNGSQNDRMFFVGTVSNQTSGNYVGGLIGTAAADSRELVTNSFVHGTVMSAGSNVGGLVGRLRSDSQILMSYFAGSVSGYDYTGGIVGRLYSNANVIDAFVSASITATTGNQGSVVGTLSSSGTIIDNVSYDQDMSGALPTGGNGLSAEVNNVTARNTDGLDPEYFFDPTNAPMTSFDFVGTWESSSGNPPLLRTTLLNYALPSAPQNIAASFPQHENEPYVSWQAPSSNGGIAITDYTYQYRIGNAAWASVDGVGNRFIGDTTTLSYEFAAQRYGLDFEYRVAAVTPYGIGEWATVSFSTPEPEVYDITTCEELQAVDDEPSARYATIRLVNDIDCTGVAFVPIGTYSTSWGNAGYMGTFNGNGRTISHVTSTGFNGSGPHGLFSYAKDALLQNVIIKDSSFTTTGATVGALAGETLNTQIRNVVVRDTTVNASYDTAGGIVGFFNINEMVDPLIVENVHTVDSTVSANSRAGGHFGALNADNFTGLTVTKSSTSGTAINAVDGGDAGGLVGHLSSYSYGAPSASNITFEDSFARFTMTEAEGGGGIVGKLNLAGSGGTDGATITMQRTYAVSNITTSNPGAGYAYTGGLMGDLTDMYAPSVIHINDSFAVSNITTDATDNLGGISGIDPAGSFVTLNNVNYYSTQGYACLDGNAAPGCSSVGDSAVFRSNSTQASLAGWNFSTVWSVVSGDYPTLDRTIPVTVIGVDTDTDDDGTLNAAEDAAPNGGDANNDGTADSQQAHVTSFLNTVSNAYSVVEVNPACTLGTVTASSASSNAVKDAAYSYANGFVSFTADCGANGFETVVEVTQYGTVAANAVARKYNPATNAYYAIPGVTIDRTTIAGQAVTIARYTVKDGGILDIDGAANGTIVDPIGFGVLAVGAPNTGLGGNARR